MQKRMSEFFKKYRELPHKSKRMVITGLLLLSWLWLPLAFLAVIAWLLSKFIKTNFFKRYKKIIIPLALLLIISPFVYHAYFIQKEKDRNYYLNVASSTNYDCNAYYNKDNHEIYCKERIVKGEFSNYPSVNVQVHHNDLDAGFAYTDGNHFESTIYPVIYFQTDDFNPDANGEVSTKVYVAVYNKILRKTVAKKTIYIHCKLTKEDMALLKQKYSEWKIAEAERKAKDAKVAADKKAADEKKAQTQAEAEAQKKAAQSTPSSTQPTTSQTDEDALFEAEVTCKEHAESYYGVKDINIHYDQSSIRRRNPDGTLLIKANIADSQGAFRPEKPLGTMECTTTPDGMRVTNFITY